MSELNRKWDTEILKEQSESTLILLLQIELLVKLSDNLELYYF